jgi:hypothetical protein
VQGGISPTSCSLSTTLLLRASLPPSRGGRSVMTDNSVFVLRSILNSVINNKCQIYYPTSLGAQ